MSSLDRVTPTEPGVVSQRLLKEQAGGGCEGVLNIDRHRRQWTGRRDPEAVLLGAGQATGCVKRPGNQVHDGSIGGVGLHHVAQRRLTD